MDCQTPHQLHPHGESGFAHKISKELLWDKQKELWIQNRDKER